MYKKIKKKAGDSWDNISRRIFGTPERAGDFEKLNANTLGDEIIIFENKENTPENEEKSGVSLEIGEKKFTDFSEYLLIDRLGGIKAGVFVFLAGGHTNVFKFNESVNIYDESGLFLTGRIANIKPRHNDRGKFIQVEIKSNAGVLIESDVPYPLESANQSIKEILSGLVGIFGQNIEFEDSGDTEEIFTNEIGTSFAAEIGENVYSYMNRLCESRGLVLNDTGNGLKVFRLNTNLEEKINFIEGQCVGVRSVKADFRGENLARYYEINSQYPVTNSVIVTTPFPVPITKRFNSDDINSNNIEETARRIVCKEIAKHFPVEIELSDNFSIKSGEIATVKQTDSLIENETDFVIKEVLRLNPDTLKLTLSLPCAYTGIMPETLPLCGE